MITKQSVLDKYKQNPIRSFDEYKGEEYDMSEEVD